MLRRVLLSSAGALALSGAAFAADLPSPHRRPCLCRRHSSAGPGFMPVSTPVIIGAGPPTASLGPIRMVLVLVRRWAPERSLPRRARRQWLHWRGQIGYNYQIQSFVLGLEVDIDGATGRNSMTDLHGADLGFVPIASNSAQQLDWLGTVRGRLGLTPIDHLLVYGTGGLAFGQSQATFISGCSNGWPSAVCLRLDLGQCRLGCGRWHRICAASKFSSNWSVKVEYLYYDLGRSTSSIFYEYAPNTSSVTGSIRHNGNIVRAGVNYHFNWGAPARSSPNTEFAPQSPFRQLEPGPPAGFFWRIVLGRCAACIRRTFAALLLFSSPYVTSHVLAARNKAALKTATQ